VFNIACGDRITLNELAGELKELTGGTTDAEHGQPRAGDIKHSLADINKAKELLGYEVLVPVREGLRRTAEWFMQHQDMLE